MTYIESALYDFVKTILTRGIRTLKDPRYLPYSLFLLLIVTVSTATAFLGDYSPVTIGNDVRDILLYVELGVAIAFLLTGLLLGRANIWFQLLALISITAGVTSIFYYEVIPNANNVAITTAAFFYITWIAIAAFSTFAIFRDLFDNEVFGTVLFLGKPVDDGKPMFGLIGWILAFLNIGLGYLIYTNGIDTASNALTFSGAAVMLFSLIAMVPLLGLQRKNDVFYSVLTLFFAFTTIRVILLAFRSITSSPGQTSYWDTVFSLFIALYAIQNAAVKGIKIGDIDHDPIKPGSKLSVEEKTMRETQSLGIVKTITRALSDRGIVLVILGTVIGFHAMQVQTIMGRSNFFQYFFLTEDADIVLLGYEVNIVASLLIYVVSFILFFLIPSFRKYANPEINRIEWAPPYEDLKIVIGAIREGEISRGYAVRLLSGMAFGKVKGKFTGNTDDDPIKTTVDKLIRKAKGEEEE